MKNILITGGAGFIGSHLTRHFSLNYSNYSIVNVDSLTYASNIEYIKEHDYRYSVNYEKLSSTTGWSPRNDFDSLLTKTIKWYLR